MNTESVKIENGLNYFETWLYLVKLSVKCIVSALKPNISNAASQPMLEPYQNQASGNFPTVSNIHGISYGENERDRLFYG